MIQRPNFGLALPSGRGFVVEDPAWDRLLALARDELDVEYVVALRVEGPGPGT